MPCYTATASSPRLAARATAPLEHHSRMEQPQTSCGAPTSKASCIINIGAKDILNCVQISLVRVAGKLHAIGETRCQIINEQLGCVAVATADEPLGRLR